MPRFSFHFRGSPYFVSRPAKTNIACSKFKMAEFAAHLNQGTANANPTIFEIIAEESMASILRPAVGYALKVLATSNPDKWGWVWRIGDEIYLCLDYFVQNHYLKNSGGSISENFYGLKRVNTGITGKKEEGISSIQRYLSVIMLVGVPYAKLKLDGLFERTREDYITGNQTSYPRRKRSYFLQLKRTFVYVYPFLHFTWETVFLCYYLMYVFQFSEVHSPLLHVIGVSLKRLTRQDILAQNVQNSHINLLKGKTLTEKLSAIPGSLGRLVVVVLASGLPVIVFFLKFIEWWYSSDNKEAVQSVTQLPVPPPPPGPKPAQHGVQLPPHPVQCPLCWKVRTNPTALSSSGYVFCYPCIYKYLNQHGCCPITHLPSATKQLIRLYVDVTN